MQFLKKIKPKRLNSAGVGHHALIAVFVVFTVAGIGAYRIWSSSAATASNSILTVGSQEGCQLAGRKWGTKDDDKNDGGAYHCLSRGDFRNKQGVINATDAELCSTPGDTYNTSGSTGFCNSFVAGTVSQATCHNRKRVFITGAGCAQSAVNQDDSPRCFDPYYPNYNRNPGDKNADLCVAKPAVDRGEVNGGTGGSQGPATGTTEVFPKQVAAEPGQYNTDIDEKTCRALGRKWDGAKGCEKACQADSGSPWRQAKGGRLYCSKAVATGMSEARCGELHRRWVGVGCAKRPDNADNASDGVRCLDGYPFYNANSTASANGATDVCEANKATSKANEANGIVGEPDAGEDEELADEGSSEDYEYSEYDEYSEDSEYDYSEYDEYGDYLTGEEADIFSDTDGLSEQEIAVVSTTAKMPKTVKPTCTNKKGKKVDAKADNSCPPKATLSCPGDNIVKRKDANGQDRCYKKKAWQSFVKMQDAIAAGAFVGSVSPNSQQPAAGAIVKADNISKDKCDLLGRKYYKKKKGEQDKGCLRACNKTGDTLSADSRVCLSAKNDNAPYAVPMSKETCDNLHRRYIGAVDMCAQLPNQNKQNGKKVNAAQCEDKYPVYIIQKGKKDECVTASFAKQLQRVANSTGKTVAKIAKGPNAAVCNLLRKNMHWNGATGQCQSDRKKEKGPGASDAPEGSPGTPAVTEQKCAELGRVWASLCVKQCKSGFVGVAGSKNPFSSSPYDYCSRVDTYAAQKHCTISGGSWSAAQSKCTFAASSSGDAKSPQQCSNGLGFNDTLPECM